MKRAWKLEDLIDCFTIVPHEMKTVGTKNGVNRLGYAVLLKYFQNEGRFPNNIGDVPKPVVEYIAKQVHVNSKAFSEYDWAGRAIKYHRAEIRDFCGFREATVEDFNSLMSWLVENVLRVAETP